MFKKQKKTSWFPVTTKSKRSKKKGLFGLGLGSAIAAIVMSAKKRIP